MDKRSIIGLVLIFLIVVGFSYLNRPSEEERARIRAQRDSIAMAEAQREADLRAFEAREAERRRSQDTLGAQKASGSIWAKSTSDRVVVLENDLLRLEVSETGGRLSSVQIKGYQTYYGDSLRYYHGDGNSFGFHFLADGSEVFTNDLRFQEHSTGQPSVAIEPGSTAAVAMRFYADSASWLEYRYTLEQGSHRVQMEVAFHGMERHIQSQQQYIDLQWNMLSPQQEKGSKKELEYTTLAYLASNGDFEQMKFSAKTAEERVTTTMSWIAFKQQFFAGFLSAPGGFSQGELRMGTPDEAGYLRTFSATLMLPFSGGAQDHLSFDFHFSPTLYKTLASYKAGFEKVVPLGGWLVSWFNKYVVINVFDWLSGFISSYGLIILILTLLIKIVIFPLTFRSYKSSAKMRALKPLVEEINAKYPRQEDAMKKQQATMALYKQAGVNPMGGCLPVLIQMPILIAMFRFFPASFELRQKGFLWTDDLSSYDSILDLPFSIPFYGDHVSLFTLLMAAALMVSSFINFKQTADTSNQMPGMKFMMLYMMPIMMVFWFNDYSSGLSYYYFLSNVITIIQTLVIRRTVDEKALLLKMQQSAKKPPKKSTFMQRLEKMQREQMKKAQQGAKRR